MPVDTQDPAAAAAGESTISPIKQLTIVSVRAGDRILISFNQAHPQWRERVDRLKALIPEPFRQLQPEGWLIHEDYAPELMELVRDAELPDDTKAWLYKLINRANRRRQRRKEQQEWAEKIRGQ